jgi:hypothetical protein
VVGAVPVPADAVASPPLSLSPLPQAAIAAASKAHVTPVHRRSKDFIGGRIHDYMAVFKGSGILRGAKTQ